MAGRQLKEFNRKTRGIHSPFYIGKTSLVGYGPREISGKNAVYIERIEEVFMCTPAPQEDFEIKDGVLIKYRGKATDVQIPDGVIAIGYEAFSGCGHLRSSCCPGRLQKRRGLETRRQDTARGR
jgi:hypothetical protein